jgi:branched-subunit amino acid aminotransferase/4-amino-4-deoxychorismate lyase
VVVGAVEDAAKWGDADAKMALARDAGFRVREGSFTLPVLLRAEEAFTSSAVREIMPVMVIDGREIPRGDAALRLQQLLETVR